MRIALSNHLLVLGGAILLAWLLVRFLLLPRAGQAVTGATPGDLIKTGGRFGLLLTLQAILDAMLIAGLLIAITATSLQLYFYWSSDIPSALQRIVQVRDKIERAIDSVGWMSGEAWLLSVIILALIWLLSSRSTSRKSWDAALRARHSALSSAIADLKGEELLARANAVSAAGVASLERNVQSILDENELRIKAMELRPVVQFGDAPENVSSLDELRRVEVTMRQRADTESDVNPEEKAALVRSVDGLRELIKEVEGSVRVELRALDRSIDVTLSRAKADPAAAIALAGDREVALRRLIVDAQLADHAALGSRRSGREPELIREWLAAGLTSVATVRTTSWVGRAAAMVCFVMLFLGFVGLGVKGVAPVLVSEAAALELRLANLAGESDLTAAMQRRAAEGADTTATVRPPTTDVASDSATVDFLRASFRSSVARSLQVARSETSVRTAARERFELGAMEARQRILQASTRSAAPSLEGGRGTQVYRFSENVHEFVPTSPRATLDEALERRIKTLRANEGLWMQLRTAAARPVTADLAGEALLKTVFPTGDVHGSPGFKMWAERASLDFATATARAGQPPGATHLVPAFSEQHALMSSRDRRLVADYRSQAPQRLERALEGIRTGSLDPGSLHRELPTASRGIAQSAYGELFPSSGGGGAAAINRPAPGMVPQKVAYAAPQARSYTKVRFSPRVGGVLIGARPQEGGEELDVRGMEWSITSDALYLTLTHGAGRWVRLGPYHPAIAHHALAYVADGRVVTSTLPQPLRSDTDDIEIEARRVAVHPAFEDTAFACPAIQVDRFVDAFTSSRRPDPANGQINLARTAVTLLGRLLPAYRELDELDAERVRSLLQPVAQHAQTCGIDAKCFPVEPYAGYGLQLGATTQFLGCVARNTEHKACLAELARKPILASYLVDSGVREAPFVLDRTLSFLTGADQGGDPLWPLDFMIQAVPQSLTTKEVEIGERWEPWRFPSVDGRIKESVARGIASNPDAQAILLDMRDFTVLQRLFRLALAGDMGTEFPLDELVKLQAATARFVKVHRSERWNHNEGLLRTLYQEHARLKSMLQEISQDAGAPAACRSAAGSAVPSEEGKSWPKAEGVWSEVGKVEIACKGAAAAERFAARLALLRRHDLIDEAISIARGELSSGELACPRL
jgi:hypothetical protein